MRIAVFTWQDVQHPAAGGAERHLQNILARLVHKADEITLYTTQWPGARAAEVLDGVLVNRLAPWWSFPVAVARVAGRIERQGAADLFVEDIHKPPLLLPIYVTTPVFVMVPHLMGITAFGAGSVIQAAMLCMSEYLLPWVYRRSLFQALSPSTAQELVTRGIPAKNVSVVPPGVDFDAFTPEPARRARAPTFLYIGRLQRYKNVQVAIDAVALTAEATPGVRLIIAGDGPAREDLERRAYQNGCGDVVTFEGSVSEERKKRLMQEAWATLQPSAKEGWGLTVLEASACGTPTLAANRPGLRDAVRPGINGILYRANSAKELAIQMKLIIEDPALREHFAAATRIYALNFSLGKTADTTRLNMLLASQRS